MENIFLIISPTQVSAHTAGGITSYQAIRFNPMMMKDYQAVFDGFCFRDGTWEDVIDGLDEIWNENAMRIALSPLGTCSALAYDEIMFEDASMVFLIDYCLRKLHATDASFGGVMTFCFGDSYQMGHMSNRGIGLKESLLEKIFKRERYISLKEYNRQVDQNSISVCSHIRLKVFCPKVMQALRNRIVGDLRSMESVFSSVMNLVQTENLKVYEYPTILCVHNHNKVENGKIIWLGTQDVNEMFIQSLGGDEETYVAIDTPEWSRQLDNEHPFPATLKLRKGAIVLFVRSYSIGRREIKAGTCARIVELFVDVVRCEISTQTEPFFVQYESLEVELSSGMRVTRSQLPFIIAYAATVSRTQSMTMESGILSIHKSFVPGMVNVAMSRIRSLGRTWLLGAAPAVENDVLTEAIWRVNEIPQQVGVVKSFFGMDDESPVVFRNEDLIC